MNYIKITQFDTANGIGIGTVLWVAGCTHNCKGCHNPQTHNPASGKLFTNATLEKLLASLSPPYISRLTLSGGDPLFEDNRAEVYKILLEVRKQYPEKKIWVYTGYDWDDIKGLPLMELIDVVVEGKFILEQRDLTLLYKGSRNQRVIDVQKSLFGSPTEYVF